MVDFKPVCLSNEDHLQGICHYRPLIEGVQCAVAGVLPDGMSVVVAAADMLVLQTHAPELLRVLRALYAMRVPFSLSLLRGVGTKADEFPRALEIALRAYRTALTLWLEHYDADADEYADEDEDENEDAAVPDAREEIQHDLDLLTKAIPRLFEPVKPTDTAQASRWGTGHRAPSRWN